MKHWVRVTYSVVFKNGPEAEVDADYYKVGKDGFVDFVVVEDGGKSTVASIPVDVIQGIYSQGEVKTIGSQG